MPLKPPPPSSDATLKRGSGLFAITDDDRTWGDLRAAICADGNDTDHLRIGADAAGLDTMAQRAEGGAPLVLIQRHPLLPFALDALQLIKNDERLRYAVTVILSRDDDADAIARCYEAGCCAVVTLPRRLADRRATYTAVAGFLDTLQVVDGDVT